MAALVAELLARREREAEMLAELDALKPCGSHPLYSAGWQDGVNAAIEVVARGGGAGDA